MKATEQYFPVVLFIMLYKVALTIETMCEILKRNHSNESYWAVLSCDTVYYVVRVGSIFFSLKTNFLSVTLSHSSNSEELSRGFVCFPIFWKKKKKRTPFLHIWTLDCATSTVKDFQKQQLTAQLERDKRTWPPRKLDGKRARQKYPLVEKQWNPSSWAPECSFYKHLLNGNNIDIS